jgi:hypothetical protein
MCTLAFELFIVSGHSELKTNDPWWSKVARVDFINLSLHATCRHGHYIEDHSSSFVGSHIS